MNLRNQENPCTLSLVIPCYNEERTLENCVQRVLKIADGSLSLEIIIVDDASRDRSYQIASELAKKHSEIKVFKHSMNLGKGAALRTGFAEATGDYVAVQDADLEYDPQDLKRLLGPLREGKADVVFGSRFLQTGAHRVLYFWHSMGNRFLTFLSNLFTDLNLTDMETCYKVFKREVIQKISIQEDRFGFEPEVVAKIAHMRLRVYEMGISYDGRTYGEGKKIGVTDGFRALYCIFRYNAHRAPLPIQFCFYTLIGGVAAFANLFIFLGFLKGGASVFSSAVIAFFLAAFVNYRLGIALLFRPQVKWKSLIEIMLFILVVGTGALLDVYLTKSFLFLNFSPALAKVCATIPLLFYNFSCRRFLIYPEKTSPSW